MILGVSSGPQEAVETDPLFRTDPDPDKTFPAMIRAFGTCARPRTLPSNIGGALEADRKTVD